VAKVTFVSAAEKSDMWTRAELEVGGDSASHLPCTTHMASRRPDPEEGLSCPPGRPGAGAVLGCWGEDQRRHRMLKLDLR
ncbi:Hypothetical predicted protein, partial [Marmota monax]